MVFNTTFSTTIYYNKHKIYHCQLNVQMNKYIFNLFSGSVHQMYIYGFNLFSGYRHQVHIDICLTYSVVLGIRCTIICLACSVVLIPRCTFYMYNLFNEYLYVLSLFSDSIHQMFISMCLSYSVALEIRCIFFYLLWRWF